MFRYLPSGVRKITKNPTPQDIPCRVFHSRRKNNHMKFYALLDITIFRSGPRKFAFSSWLCRKTKSIQHFSVQVFLLFLGFSISFLKTLSTRQWLSKAGHGRRDDPHLSPAGQLGAAELAAKCRELHQQRQANRFTKTVGERHHGVCIFPWRHYWNIIIYIYIHLIRQDCKGSVFYKIRNSLATSIPYGGITYHKLRNLTVG